jgi:hypothetical protein
MADLCGTDEAADEQQNKGAIGSATFRSSNSSRPKPSLSHHFFSQRQVHALRAHIEKNPSGAAS